MDDLGMNTVGEGYYGTNIRSRLLLVLAMPRSALYR